jgi:membrane-bound lytic murein transglycosylase D
MVERIILTTALWILAAGTLVASPDGRKTRKQLEAENKQMQERIEQLEAQVQAYRQEAEEREEIEEMLSGENENKSSFGMEEYDAPDASTDSLLGRWYMYRQRNSSREESYDMDSVVFTTDVPDSVLMGRLERMNAFISLPYNETVKNYMVMYSEKMPRKMAEMMGLAQYYFPIFEETFRKYDLPLELKYMAIIESALNPRAESRAGAKGTWQFMYRTAINYGLKIDSYVDERMDPFLSADAAAHYLQDAYRIFGDWSLAISSYNCGSGNVNKAIKRAGGKRDFWSIYDYLPRETRGYVPAMVGAMYAFTYAKEYGLQADPVALPVYVDTFHVNRNLHMRQISEVLGIPLDDVRDLNPQYHKDILPGASEDVVLRLPFDYTAAFLDQQDTIARYKADILFTEKVADGREVVSGSRRPTASSSGSGSWVYYTVKSGDNLGKIARKYHTTVKQLKSWNNMKSDFLSIGKRLKVGKK